MGAGRAARRADLVEASSSSLLRLLALFPFVYLIFERVRWFGHITGLSCLELGLEAVQQEFVFGRRRLSFGSLGWDG